MTRAKKTLLMAGMKKRKQAPLSPNAYLYVQALNSKIDDLQNSIVDLQNSRHQQYVMMADLENSKHEQYVKVAALENSVKEMRPILKRYVRKRGLALVNEFISFICQVHKCGFPKKFNKSHKTDKFGPLDHNVGFQASCQLFLKSHHDDPKVTTPANISELFSKLCDKRNCGDHYEEPEDCLLHIQKFGKKHAGLLEKCVVEVQYCVPRMVSIAKHFIGLYRLNRLTCQFIACVLISHGLIWKDMTELAMVLTNNHECIDIFMPEGCLFKDYSDMIFGLFMSSKSNGPKWNGTSRDDTIDYLSIQMSFNKCKNLGMLPPRFPCHNMEYSILEHTW